MNKRDEKITNCIFDYWIVFIYINIDGVTTVVLFEKDGNWFPYYTSEAMPFENIRKKVNNELSIASEHCFKDRYISVGLDVNFPEDDILNAQTSFIRLKSIDSFKPMNEKYKNFKWFTKEEACRCLKEKPFQVAFENVFVEETMWESVDTEVVKSPVS